MRTPVRFRSLAPALALLIVPGLIFAEVSVKLNPDGSYQRTLFLTRATGRSQIIWGQVRARLPQAQILNPLGDNLGDLAPIIRTNPASRLPWVFWSMNIANQKRIGFSFWSGRTWTTPMPVATAADPYFLDQLDPDAVFDQAGVPYLVWWTASPIARVYFSTLVRGRWSPPMPMSGSGVDSRKPTIAIRGTSVVITYQTPAGRASTVYETAILLDSASKLMDGPTPPGNSGGGDGGQGGDSGGGDDTPLIRR
ncbi:MAG TPA: hypothetical protein VFT43_06540 [Candidatus Polarisedimenticolia bacterium]|nr:hypothetical protein [Candidatus Polarisedimenticolia bacterium]